MLMYAMFLEIWIVRIAETEFTTMVRTLAFIILAVTLVFSFEIPLSVSKGSPQFI